MFKDVTLGQYYQADSVIHRLDPRVKLAGTFLYMISLFVFNNIFCYIVSAILLLAVIILCKIPIGYMLKGMRAVIFIMVFAVVFNVLFTEGEIIWKFWIFHVSLKGIKMALLMVIRLTLLIISVSDRILPGAWDILSKTSTIVMGISSAAVVFMYLVFIMLDMHKIRKGIRRLIPRRYRREAGEFASSTDQFMGTYFRAQSMVAFTVGVLYAIGFSVMGLPMGMAFGLFSGALNMIPYMQLTTIPLALLLAVVYALDKGMPFWEVALIILTIYLVVQIIQDFFLVPHIVGKSMNLPPVGILLSLSIWGKLLGFLGLLVAIPFTCICLVYVEKLRTRADQYVEDAGRLAPKA